jgi:thioredoxin reductase (NADPH)
MIKTLSGDIEARSVVLAMGSSPQKMEVDGEDRLMGKGVSYCAVCDGAFFKGQKVMIVGGGNSALSEAIYLSRLASEVYLVHRRDEYRGSKSIQDKINENKKIIPMLSSIVTKVNGKERVESATLRNVKTNREQEVKVDGIFVAIGHIPDTGFLGKLLKLDDKGYIITDDKLQTSEPGIFAIGDVRNTYLRQVATAVGDGANVSSSVEKYLHGI